MLSHGVNYVKWDLGATPKVVRILVGLAGVS